MGRTSRTRIASTVVLSVAVFAAVMIPPAIATAPATTDPATCRVHNVRTGEVGGDLQASIDEATAGDAIRLSGTCGAVTIGTSLRLIGPAAIAAPICEQCGAGTMVTIGVGAVVTLRDVTVTGGVSSWDAGGLLNEGTVILAGQTSIRGNVAEDNAAGVDNYGTMVMTDRATVTDNSLYYRGDGGGIRNSGSLYLTEHSSVSANSASRGAGIFNSGVVVLRGAARVSANSAETGGGVYNDNDGTLVFKDWSRVVRNSAPGYYDDDTGTLVSTGGGVFTAGAVRIDRRWRGVVCMNEPDNWDRPTIG